MQAEQEPRAAATEFRYRLIRYVTDGWSGDGVTVGCAVIDPAAGTLTFRLMLRPSPAVEAAIPPGAREAYGAAVSGFMYAMRQDWEEHHEETTSAERAEHAREVYARWATPAGPFSCSEERTVGAADLASAADAVQRRISRREGPGPGERGNANIARRR